MRLRPKLPTTALPPAHPAGEGGNPNEGKGDDGDGGNSDDGGGRGRSVVPNRRMTIRSGAMEQYLKAHPSAVVKANPLVKANKNLHMLSSSGSGGGSDKSGSYSEHDLDCWVCKGTGQVTGLANEMEFKPDMREGHGDGGGEQKGGGGGGSGLGLEALDEPVCPICYSDPPQYGISTECTHFYCSDCVHGHLTSVLNNGKFPGYCPLCQNMAPKGEQPRCEPRARRSA